MDIPFSNFGGVLKSHSPGFVNEKGRALFDYFFPNFNFLHDFHSKNDLKVIVTEDGLSLTGRGRERRFAGDSTLARGRYFSLQNPDKIGGKFNPLICEFFAYADPAVEVQPSILDSTIAEDRELQQKMGMGMKDFGPHLSFFIKKEDIPALPAAIAPERTDGHAYIPISLHVSEREIPNVIDLRLPETQQWFFETFYRMELASRRTEGASLQVADGILVSPPRELTNFFGMLPTLVAPLLGGGLPFIQGVGAFLRSHGAKGLVYPSARTDFGVMMSDGKPFESWGWNFVSYQDSAATSWAQFFGKCSKWLDWEEPVQFVTDSSTASRVGSWGVRNLRALHEHKYQQDKKKQMLAKRANRSPGVKANENSSAAKQPASRTPESFVESAQLSMVACLNDPQVCDALDAVDPDAPDAMDNYAKIFASAIPGFPLLNENEMVRVAEAIRLAAKLTDEIKPNEIIAFLLSHLRPRPGSRYFAGIHSRGFRRDSEA